MIGFKDKRKKKFERALEEYLHASFRDRNIETISRYLGDSYFGCGTGIDEQVYTKEDALKIMGRNFESLTQPLSLRFRKKELQILNDTTAIFQACFDLNFQLFNKDMTFSNLRLTLVFHEVGEEIKVAANHLSLPTSEHEEGESYPVKEASYLSDRGIDTIEIRF